MHWSSVFLALTYPYISYMAGKFSKSSTNIHKWHPISYELWKQGIGWLLWFQHMASDMLLRCIITYMHRKHTLVALQHAMLSPNTHKKHPYEGKIWVNIVSSKSSLSYHYFIIFMLYEISWFTVPYYKGASLHHNCWKIMQDNDTSCNGLLTNGICFICKILDKNYVIYKAAINTDASTFWWVGVGKIC